MDIIQRLRAVASGMQGIIGPSVIEQGIAEIERLRKALADAEARADALQGDIMDGPR
jgi:hypothetical protein